jgi:hypothetical protein
VGMDGWQWMGLDDALRLILDTSYLRSLTFAHLCFMARVLHIKKKCIIADTIHHTPFCGSREAGMDGWA